VIYLLTIFLKKKVSERDAESRRNSVIALMNVCQTLGKSEIQSKLKEIFDALIIGMNDYSCDNRGDVGVYVREASIQSLEKLLILSFEHFTKEMKIILISEIMKQSLQPIEKYRESAIKSLKRILKNNLEIPFENEIKLQLENENETIFTNLIKCVTFDDYCYQITEGIVLSIGNPTSHCVLNFIF
jgi:tubulin-specific chaperone D